MIDAHFHVWRQADLPWLSGPMQPRIFGPYDAIRRDYPMAEYLDDIKGQGITKAVYVQANWPVERAEAEADWIEHLIVETGWPHATVAFADVTVADARPALDRLSRFPHVRAIRQQFHWHDTPQYRFAAHPDLCDDPQVQANIARLADYGWAFDLQVFTDQMPGAARLAAACPGVILVLQHAGMLDDLSEQGRAAWRIGMETVSKCPNIHVKLSGFGTFQHRLDPDEIGWLTSETVALFGAHRCLWGSNFPIEKLWTTYADLLNAQRAAIAGFSAADRTAIFNDTASRVYRL